MGEAPHCGEGQNNKIARQGSNHGPSGKCLGLDTGVRSLELASQQITGRKSDAQPRYRADLPTVADHPTGIFRRKCLKKIAGNMHRRNAYSPAASGRRRTTTALPKAAGEPPSAKLTPLSQNWSLSLKTELDLSAWLAMRLQFQTC